MSVVVPAPGLHVFKAHQLVATHPQDALQVIQPDGSIQITHQGQVIGTYAAGDWHVVGQVVCGFVDPDPTCPRCNPPASPSPAPRRPTLAATLRNPIVLPGEDPVVTAPS